jgi:integrase
MDLATLTIARSISDAGKVVAEKGTKTHQARRIALDPSTVDALRQHRKLMEERALAAGKTLGASCYIRSQELDASRPYRPDRVSGASDGTPPRATKSYARSRQIPRSAPA